MSLIDASDLENLRNRVYNECQRRFIDPFYYYEIPLGSGYIAHIEHISEPYDKLSEINQERLSEYTGNSSLKKIISTDILDGMNYFLDELESDSLGLSCNSECTGLCVDDCSGKCSYGCDGECSYSCGGVCSEGCGEGCGNECSYGCSEYCAYSCSEGCGEGCGSDCSTGCGYNCGEVCSMTCGSACSTGCGYDSF